MPRPLGQLGQLEPSVTMVFCVSPARLATGCTSHRVYLTTHETSKQARRQPDGQVWSSLVDRLVWSFVVRRSSFVIRHSSVSSVCGRTGDLRPETRDSSSNNAAMATGVWAQELGVGS